MLSAAVSLQGTLEILGFTVLNAEVDAAMTYAIEAKRLSGSLQITLAAVFGKELGASVEATVKLGDGAGAPLRAMAALASPSTGTFADRYSQTNWSDYCNAFA